ncbi:MAG TPA: hypothetical protein VH185_06055 [Mycobacterium sp.]|nr:hypothetical protein [Mycobacterium sp.]
MQQKLIDAITPYTVPTGSVDAFASTQQGRDIQEFLVQYVATFVPAASGENFNPHITTGAGPQTYLDEMMAEPFEAFTFSPLERRHTNWARLAPRKRSSRRSP